MFQAIILPSGTLDCVLQLVV